MALHKLERRNYGRESPVSIKYQNLHTFKEELILLCQSILENKKNNTFTRLRSLYNPFKQRFFSCIGTFIWWYVDCSAHGHHMTR